LKASSTIFIIFGTTSSTIIFPLAAEDDLADASIPISGTISFSIGYLK